MPTAAVMTPQRKHPKETMDVRSKWLPTSPLIGELSACNPTPFCQHLPNGLMDKTPKYAFYCMYTPSTHHCRVYNFLCMASG